MSECRLQNNLNLKKNNVVVIGGAIIKGTLQFNNHIEFTES